MQHRRTRGSDHRGGRTRRGEREEQAPPSRSAGAGGQVLSTPGACVQCEPVRCLRPGSGLALAPASPLHPQVGDEGPASPHPALTRRVSACLGPALPRALPASKRTVRRRLMPAGHRIG
ncbi:hypothetical protein CALCODRAFT_278779 [Calocera cornea HHB12733]|uniref:Uncharacterized protein n=1 Tax=Calocera cornea HHB12733 TaxID=1353952 RepID=A0A165JRC6_9BASI|nr:hypothetical protein CALCODRAFT_278779 [Calocera cornea HHB12733]